MRASQRTAPEGVLARLRADTADAHAALERRLDIYRRIATPAGRLALVERFWGLHRAADVSLEPWLATLDGLQFQARRRERLLSRDLATLGCADVAALPLSAMPEIASQAAALGFFYVLEGSTLGGRVIRKEVERNGGDMRGLSFLDPYGDQAGSMWKRFVLVLEQAAPPCYSRAIEDAVDGARGGFELVAAWLCGSDAPS